MSKSKLGSLVKWLKRECDIDVTLNVKYYSENRIIKENRHIQGMSGTDGHIELVFDKKDLHSSFLVSLLIHEFGHQLLDMDGVYRHSELVAWERGLQNTPKKFIPDSVGIDLNFCLGTYNYKRRYCWDHHRGRLRVGRPKISGPPPGLLCL